MSTYQGVENYGDSKKRAQQFRSTIIAFTQGGVIGALSTGAAGYLLRNRMQSIQRMSTGVKSMFVISGGLALGTVLAEKAGMAIEEEAQSHMDARQAVFSSEKSEFDRKFDQLSTFDKALTWTKEHKFSVVLGSWATSLGASWLYIRSQPFTVAQRLVQARVWAQGLTIASLLAMAGITSIPSAGDKLIAEQADAKNHTWESVLKASEQDRN